MKRRLFGRSLLAVAVLGSACCSDSSEPLYKDVSQPVERRIDDLMGRMTLREKIGQMCQFVGLEHLRMAERNATPEEIRDGHAQGYYPGYHSTDILRMVEALSLIHISMWDFWHFPTCRPSTAPARVANIS